MIILNFKNCEQEVCKGYLATYYDDIPYELYFDEDKDFIGVRIDNLTEEIINQLKEDCANNKGFFSPDFEDTNLDEYTEIEELKDINAILISTNAGYELFANGTIQDVTPEALVDYKNPKNIPYIEGRKVNTTVEEIFDSVIPNQYEIISYYEDNKLVIVDENLWQAINYDLKAHWLQEILIQENFSYYELSKKSGLNQGTLFNMVKNNVPIEKLQLSAAYGIANALGLPLIKFLERYYPNK